MCVVFAFLTYQKAGVWSRYTHSIYCKCKICAAKRCGSVHLVIMVNGKPCTCSVDCVACDWWKCSLVVVTEWVIIFFMSEWIVFLIYFLCSSLNARLYSRMTECCWETNLQVHLLVFVHTCEHVCVFFSSCFFCLFVWRMEGSCMLWHA